jgi:hypothetical protein
MENRNPWNFSNGRDAEIKRIFQLILIFGLSLTSLPIEALAQGRDYGWGMGPGLMGWGYGTGCFGMILMIDGQGDFS